MNSSDPGTALAVLVLCEDAADYRPFLNCLSAQDIPVDIASTPLAALDAYKDHQILLAQPDFAAAVIDNMPQVEWVQSTWSGIKPLLKTRRNDYLLTGVKDVFGAQMAQYTLAQILAYEQKTAQRYHYQTLREWWDEPSGNVEQKTLGIMGTGSIGSHIARTARGIGLKVSGFSSSGAAHADFDQVFASDKLHDFLGQADYVVAALPDTASTTELMNADSFAAMKYTALFINIGRGNLVDEAALAEALKSQVIAGAVLDVVRKEPLAGDSPLWHLPNLLITGHTAARSWPRDIVGIFLDNYQRFVQQQPLQFQIDRQRGY